MKKTLVGLLSLMLVSISVPLSAGVEELVKYVPEKTKGVFVLDVDNCSKFMPFVDTLIKSILEGKTQQMDEYFAFQNRVEQLSDELKNNEIEIKDYHSIYCFEYEGNYLTLLETDITPEKLDKIIKNTTENAEVLKSVFMYSFEDMLKGADELDAIFGKEGEKDETFYHFVDKGILLIAEKKEFADKFLAGLKNGVDSYKAGDQSKMFNKNMVFFFNGSDLTSANEEEGEILQEGDFEGAIGTAINKAEGYLLYDDESEKFETKFGFEYSNSPNIEMMMGMSSGFIGMMKMYGLDVDLKAKEIDAENKKMTLAIKGDSTFSEKLINIFKKMGGGRNVNVRVHVKRPDDIDVKGLIEEQKAKGNAVVIRMGNRKKKNSKDEGLKIREE